MGTVLALHAAVGPALRAAGTKLFIFVLPTMTVWLCLVALGASRARVFACSRHRRRRTGVAHPISPRREPGRRLENMPMIRSD
ncbi:hypothetical protein C7I55_19550 [Sphingomonas deserti]|uniref:Uncharacterized protein n=1 Tax=Allosphingosinicella deserti TaxID=2116704 RepID=A0A2P7QIY0_9SPHN|nr:hypothetical protein C7I55_19550 [Sphingomonas deserti]